MRVPLSWLSEYVDINLPIPELAERITLAGLEVGAIEYIGLPKAELPWDPKTVMVAEWSGAKWTSRTVQQATYYNFYITDMDAARLGDDQIIAVYTTDNDELMYVTLDTVTMSITRVDIAPPGSTPHQVDLCVDAADTPHVAAYDGVALFAADDALLGILY